jgi:hypothetical protein
MLVSSHTVYSITPRMAADVLSGCACACLQLLQHSVGHDTRILPHQVGSSSSSISSDDLTLQLALPSDNTAYNVLHLLGLSSASKLQGLLLASDTNCNSCSFS